jgi:hypothetical protein
MGACVQAIAMWPMDVPKPERRYGLAPWDEAELEEERRRKAARLQPRKASTLRLRRIRVSYDWFQTMKARERDAFWKEVEAMFGVDVPWKLDSRVEFSFTGQHKLMVERRA